MKKVLVIISFLVILAGCSQEPVVTESATEGSIGSVLSYENFDISLEDAYYSNFPHDGIEIEFDRYLAADFKITNTSNDSVVAKTLTNFTVVDENDNLSRVMIDENRKKFSSNLFPGDSFEITLVFPVMKASEYTIYYSAGASVDKENVLSWTFSLDNTKAKDVDKTVEHRDVGDVVKSFLIQDGSNKIEFEYKPASDDSEATSETTSEAKSEVSENE